jgi:hypothetical protein
MRNAVALSALASVIVFLSLADGPGFAQSAQPVLFPHVVHVTGHRIDCRFCHIYATRANSAGIPSAEKCGSCHRVIATSNPEVQKVIRASKEKKAIAWNRVAKVPDHVYFPHHKMINAGVPCLLCHPGMDRATTAVQKRAFTMGWCMACHRQRGVSIDCWTCHK